MHTYFCVHIRAHKTILCARRSVDANIKFVEACTTAKGNSYLCTIK